MFKDSVIIPKQPLKSSEDERDNEADEESEESINDQFKNYKSEANLVANGKTSQQSQ